MKQFRILLIALALALGTQISKAQSRVAYVNVTEITSTYPAIVDAQKQVQKLNEDYSAEYKKSTDELQAKIESYESETTKTSDAINKERQKEVQEMQKRLADFKNNAEKELQKKQQELLTPLVEKVKVSIQKVGKVKKFQYVLDSSTLLLSDGTNLTSDVKKDLGF